MRQIRLTKWLLILVSAGQMMAAGLALAADPPQPLPAPPAGLSAPFFPAALNPVGLLTPPPPPSMPGVGSGGAGSGGSGFASAS
ncbi:MULTISPECIES: hypothetical protein [unclassified Agarivorans]|uniref:hypothetical protein n=1 Tax=unclassified Agarivorans TaxID=2636026 RepID=UPI003D7CF956